MACDYVIDPSKVANVLGISTDTDLSEYIDSASTIIDHLLDGCAAGQWDGVIASRIGTWLAAHFYATVHNLPSGLTSQSANGASESYNRPSTEQGIKGTHFGVNALNLDPTGCLMSYFERSTRRRARLYFGGNHLGDTKRRYY